MRVLHAIWSVDPRDGGPVEGIKQRAHVWKDLGHEITLLSSDSPDDPWVKECPLQVVALGPAKGRFGFVPGMAEWVREHHRQFDAFLGSGIWQYPCLALHKGLKGTGRHYFVFAHGMLDPWFNKTYPLKMLKKYLYWFSGAYAMLRDAKAVMFTSEEERLLARSSFRPYRVNECVVPYGTLGPEMPLEEAMASFRSCVVGLGERPYLLYLSRIHVKKGVDYLIEAYAKAYPHDGPVLVMAGPDKGNLRPALEDSAAKLGVADRVLWPGMVEGVEKWGAYAGAEAFVLPSHQENFGIVVAEALSCQTPVLISDKVNIWREIDQSGAGFVGADDLEGTVYCLSKWRDLPETEKQAMRLRALACFKDHFNVRRSAEVVAAIVSA